jgi:two-component system, NtrC family, sensor histidine kinase GlrK
VKRIQSPTLFRLVLVGFLVVVTPLAGAIITAIAQVDRLARDSRHALVAVQENATLSRSLADSVTAMERSARQLLATADPSFQKIYADNRQEVLSLYDRLSQSSIDPGLRARLGESRALESATHAVVESAGRGATADRFEKSMDALRESVRDVMQLQNAMARDLANAMPDQARDLQRTLLIQAVLVIPLSIALSALFVMLIVRPLRQIDAGIHALGRGDLAGNVRIVGTRDLEELGRRLEWLRLRLLELEAEKSRFLRNVSHELKTPLTNIRESAELLAEEDSRAADPERKVITQVLRDNSLRLQQMIEQLLRYGAEGDAGDDRLDQPVQLDLLVDAVADRYALTAASRGIAIRSVLVPVVVTGSSRRLEVIVDNLLSNAVKYTPDNGRIDLELTENATEVLLDVRDDGPGVPENLRPRVFDWFVTGPRPHQWKVAGTGMGLAIAREYALQHHGDIRLVDSPGGAHFRLAIRKKDDERA